MSVLKGIAVGFVILAAVECAAAMIGAGIPVMRDKMRKRRRRRG